MLRNVLLTGFLAVALGAGPAFAAEYDTSTYSTDGEVSWSVLPPTTSGTSIQPLSGIGNELGSGGFTTTDGSTTYSYYSGCCYADIQSVSSTTSNGATYLSAAANYSGAGTYMINDDPGYVDNWPALSFSANQTYFSGIVDSDGISFYQGNTLMDTITSADIANAERAESVSGFTWVMNNGEYSGGAQYLNVDFMHGATYTAVVFDHLADASVSVLGQAIGGTDYTILPSPMPALGGSPGGLLVGLLGLLASGLRRKRAAAAV